LRRYRNFMFVQENHQQASPVSWDYPFNDQNNNLRVL
jgi:hypothetical protein